MREKVGKSRNTVFFQWFGAPEGRKVGSLKRRVQSQLARWEMKNCTPLWREAHLQVKMYKHLSSGPLLEVAMSKKWRRCGAKHISKSKCTTHKVRTTFGSWDVKKVHVVVARSTFPSQNVQNTPGPDHFWQLRCRKSARRCGAKHISKSKCAKHHMFAPLLEVRMLKKCTPLWREAHFEVKITKHQGFGPLLEVQMPLRFTTLHYTTLHSTTLHCTALHYITQHYNYTPLHYTTLHYTTLPSTTLHYITLHYTPLQLQLHNSTTLQLQLHNYTPLQYHYSTLHYTKLHYTTLRYTTLHYTTLHYTTLHYLPLHFTTLHYTTLHYTTTTTTQLHSTTIHSTALNYTTLHCTTLHYTALHYTTLHYTEWHCTTDRQVDRQIDR